MPHPEAVRLGTSPHIKIGQGNPVWEIVSQKYAKRSETVSALPVRSLSKRPFLCSGPRSVHAGSLVVGSASVRPYDYRLVYLLVFLSCVGPIWDLQSFFFSFFHKMLWAPPIFVSGSASFSISCYMKSLWWKCAWHQSMSKAESH